MPDLQDPQISENLLKRLLLFRSDHNEAVELWNRIPPDQRSHGDLLLLEAPKDTQTASGYVHSVFCDKEKGTTLTVESDGKMLSFHSKGGVLTGFSDTIWYGRDHYTYCRHIEGLRGVVHYKPPSDSASAGDPVDVEVRDDLPPSPDQPSTATAAGGNMASYGANSTRIQEPPYPPRSEGPIDILTDTKGVDLSSYLRGVVDDVRQHWYRVMPPSAKAPLRKKGVVLIGFRLMKDGKVTDLHYVEQSGDSALDQAAYDGIASSSPFLPLPKNFACDFVALQFHFYYNPTKDMNLSPAANIGEFPCVTSAVHSIGDVEIKVSPNSAVVAVGASYQFSAILTGTQSSVVNWSIKGTGCAASACGSISADGLYTAPAALPIPPQITVTAALASDPGETDSATVTIVPVYTH